MPPAWCSTAWLSPVRGRCCFRLGCDLGHWRFDFTIFPHVDLRLAELGIGSMSGVGTRIIRSELTSVQCNYRPRASTALSGVCSATTGTLDIMGGRYLRQSHKQRIAEAFLSGDGPTRELSTLHPSATERCSRIS